MPPRVDDETISRVYSALDGRYSSLGKIAAAANLRLLPVSIALYRLNQAGDVECETMRRAGGGVASLYRRRASEAEVGHAG